MKKLYFYSGLACLCSSLTFSLTAFEPDVSNSATYQDVFRELDDSIVTHLDLRMAKANIFLNSEREWREFPNLESIRSGEFKINLDEFGQYNKLLCEVDVHCSFHGQNGEGFSAFSTYPFHNDGHYTLVHHCNLITSQKIYTTIKDFAKKYINQLINDENIVVVLRLKYREWDKNDKSKEIIISLAKWENGQAVYYEGFMRHLGN